MPQTLEQISIDQLQPKQFPEDVRTTPTGKFGNSLTLAKGTLLGKKTADGKLYAYNNANADGTETAVAILPCPVATDASGNIYLGDSAVPNSLNPAVKTVPVIIGGGVWDTSDLTGYDAAALADLGGRTLFNGLIRLP
jgi:hypothetical protein